VLLIWGLKQICNDFESSITISQLAANKFFWESLFLLMHFRGYFFCVV
jgi:hypothetical protein